MKVPDYDNMTPEEVYTLWNNMPIDERYHLSRIHTNEQYLKFHAKWSAHLDPDSRPNNNPFYKNVEEWQEAWDNYVRRKINDQLD